MARRDRRVVRSHGDAALDGWVDFGSAVELIEADTGCRPVDAASWLRRRIQDGDTEALLARNGERFDHRAPPAARARPVPNRGLRVRLEEVRAALPKLPPHLWGPGYQLDGHGRDEWKRVCFDDVVRLYAEAVRGTGKEPSLDNVWDWLHPKVDAGLISVLGSRADCDVVKNRGGLDGGISDFFTGPSLRATLARVEFLEEEVRHWLPARTGPVDAPVPDHEPEPRGPKPKWNWTPIIAKAAVEYHEACLAGRPLAWKSLRDRIGDLAERQNGKRPSRTVSGEQASALREALAEAGNSADPIGGISDRDKRGKA